MARSEQGFTLVELVAYLGLFSLLVGIMMGTEGFARKQSAFEAAHSQSIGEMSRLIRLLRQDVRQAADAWTEEDGQRLVLSILDEDGQLRTISYGVLPDETSGRLATYRVAPGEASERTYLSGHLEGLLFQVEGDVDAPRLVWFRAQATYRAGGGEVVYRKAYEAVFRSRIEERD